METISTEGTLYETFSLLVRVQTAQWNALDARLRAEHDLPLGQYSVLELIATVPDCRVQDIAEIVHITVGGASKVVDRLVASGYVDRTAHPTDRRSAVLRTTASGRAVLKAAGGTADETLAVLYGEPLTTAALAALGRTLARLDAAVAAYDLETEGA